MRCVRFWLKVLTSEMYKGRLLRKIARQAVECGKGISAVCFSRHCPWKPSYWLTCSIRGRLTMSHGWQCSIQWQISSTFPLLHSLHSLSSLTTPFHLPTSIWNATVPPLNFIIIFLSLFLPKTAQHDSPSRAAISFSIPSSVSYTHLTLPTNREV